MSKARYWFLMLGGIYLVAGGTYFEDDITRLAGWIAFIIAIAFGGRKVP